MRLAVVSAVLLFWLEGTLCAASPLMLASPLGSHTAPSPHAAEEALGPCGGSGAPQAYGHRPDHGAVCEAHCRVVAQKIPAAHPDLLPRPTVAFPLGQAARDSTFGPERAPEGPQRRRHPPRAVELFLRHQSFLI